MIRYIDVSQFACDVTFGFFLVSWLITRHLLFIRVIISTIIEVKRLIPIPGYIAFCFMLVALQVYTRQMLVFDLLTCCCRSFRLYGFG
jgi:very-long-chain ceramide synthase